MKDKDTKILEEAYKQIEEAKRPYDDDSEWYDRLQRRSDLDPDTYEKGEEYESKIRALKYKVNNFLDNIDLRKELEYLKTNPGV